MIPDTGETNCRVFNFLLLTSTVLCYQSKIITKIHFHSISSHGRERRENRKISNQATTFIYRSTSRGGDFALCYLQYAERQ